MIKLTKTDEEIIKLKKKIDERFTNNFKEKISKIKNKLYKYKAQQIYKQASNNLYNTLSKMK